jgi:hypothetical protein
MKKLSNQTAPALLPEQELPADAVISLPRRIDAGGENRLRWWRTMPPGMFTSDDRQALQDILSATAIIGEREWKYARRGCAASAFGIALPMIPIVRSGPIVDLAMSAVLLCALNGNGAAAGVMVHALRSLAGGRELAAEWREAELPQIGRLGC